MHTHSPTLSRRHFLGKSALLAAGALAAGHHVSRGETDATAAGRSINPDLSTVLQSYGTTRHVAPGGHEMTRVGSRSRNLPVTRIAVDVQDRDAFQDSFRELARRHERVLVDGNTVRIARNGTLFVIANRIA